jgi:hypothetical protein
LAVPNAGTDGGAPAGGVTFGHQGNLYGSASAGGDPNCSCGVIFKITLQSDGKWSYSVPHRFKGTDGYGPGYNLIFEQSCKHLYGTTASRAPFWRQTAIAECFTPSRAAATEPESTPWSSLTTRAIYTAKRRGAAKGRG